MENDFTKVMSERSNTELIKIVTVEREKYNASALEAAHIEIENRQIHTTEFKNIKSRVTTSAEQKHRLETNAVSSGIRFLNCIIDLIVWFILAYLCSFIIEILINPTTQAMITLFAYLLIFGTYIAYYAVMELAFQKTVGKCITNTKVVKLNGEKPNTSDILTRTFCRLIPFDTLSFLFTKNGFHDRLSQTKVVKETMP